MEILSLLLIIVLIFIIVSGKSNLEKKQKIPTQREIAKGCGISLSKVNDYLSQLEAQGRIIRIPFKSRGIRLVEGNLQENDTAEDVYDYLLDTIPLGEAPTQKEIGAACFLSRGDVRRALIWLEAQGRIKRGAGQRDIQLIER